MLKELVGLELQVMGRGKEGGEVVVVWERGGTNEQQNPQKSKADLCPVGGDSPVITTIGYGDSAHRSLRHPC